MDLLLKMREELLHINFNLINIDNFLIFYNDVLYFFTIKKNLMPENF